MKTTQRSLHRRARLALFAGLAVLTAALAFTAALRFAEDSRDETAMSKSGKAPAAPDATASGAQETAPGQEKKPPELNSRLAVQTTPDDMPGTDRSGWIYDPSESKKMNRIRKYLYDQYGSSDIHRKENGRTPRGVIEILVEGMDDLTAAKYLYAANWGDKDWPMEREYAIEYANRVLAKDPTSLEALILKAIDNVDAVESARLLIQHYPNDERAVSIAVDDLYRNFPEETIAAISRLLPEDGLHSNSRFHTTLGDAYERLDMMYEATDQFQKAYAAGNRWVAGRYRELERGERRFPSIWEERAAAAAESAKQTPQPAETEMAAAYADFAKAYQDVFEMEYGLSEATPEGYMNALLGMARAFAKAGDAQHAQDAYNAVRKRHSREEVEQAFRRFDEQERLKRQPPNEDEEEDDS